MEAEPLLVALRRIMRAVDLHSKKLEREVGLTVPQILVLLSVHAAGSLRVSDIARDVSLSQATVTSVLDRLEKKGYVRRERRQDDRRAVSITLTSEGAARVDDAPDLLQEDFVARFTKLEPWEQNMLTSAVQRVASLMDAPEVDVSPILQVGEILPEKTGR
ncbi:MAG: MarR family transcriptional regulator [Lysobacterales bacterium]|jgi:DNA-binding MarR family transcriptional regulator